MFSDQHFNRSDQNDYVEHSAPIPNVHDAAIKQTDIVTVLLSKVLFLII